MASRLRARLIAGVLVFLGTAQVASAAAPPVAPAVQPDAEAQPELVDQPAPGAPKDLWYGAAARLRWVSIPKWLLNGFTKENVPLSSWATGLELFRRKGNFEFAIAFSYQNMSPPDGNWLGSSANPATETNFVHFDNFVMYGFDASLLWHTYFNDWFGLRYGAGFGIGILGGHIVRTYLKNGQLTTEDARLRPASRANLERRCGGQFPDPAREGAGDSPRRRLLRRVLPGRRHRLRLLIER